MSKNIRQGQIWMVIADDFFATTDLDKEKYKGRKGRVHLLKGEKIEIRFPFAWNYRTEDNIYLHSDESYILEKCVLFGTVTEKVRANNKATLEEILRLDLYEKFKN